MKPSEIIRALLETEDMEKLIKIAKDLQECAVSWEAEACLIGNVTAKEIYQLALWAELMAEDELTRVPVLINNLP